MQDWSQTNNFNDQAMYVGVPGDVMPAQFQPSWSEGQEASRNETFFMRDWMPPNQFRKDTSYSQEQLGAPSEMTSSTQSSSDAIEKDALSQYCTSSWPELHRRATSERSFCTLSPTASSRALETDALSQGCTSLWPQLQE